MDWLGRVNWIGRRRGRFNSADRINPGPLYHVRNARSLLYRFRYWLRPFHGVATKYLLRYFSWYLRMVALSHIGLQAAAKLLFFEALEAYSLPRPGNRPAGMLAVVNIGPVHYTEYRRNHKTRRRRPMGQRFLKGASILALVWGAWWTFGCLSSRLLSITALLLGLPPLASGVVFIRAGLNANR